MISVSTPPMSLGWTKKTSVPCAPMRGSPRTRAPLRLELGLGGVDVGDFEADVMLPAERVLLEELHDGRIRRRAARSVRSASSAYRRSTRGRPARGRSNGAPCGSASNSLRVELEALLDRRRGDADMVEAAEVHADLLRHPGLEPSPMRWHMQSLKEQDWMPRSQLRAMTISAHRHFGSHELAMKQASCARWWRSAMAASSGASPPQVTCGRSVTRVIAILPSARFSSTPSASST